jgi:hypothetical protein
MIESVILSALKADAQLIALVSTFRGQPAIFSDTAPEGVIKPYITFRLDRRSANDLAVAEFSLYVDYWDYSISRVNARKASERIEFLLDQKDFEHERYSTIRVSFFSGGPVEEDDLKAIHYNQLFDVRAFRKKWIDQL